LFIDGLKDSIEINIMFDRFVKSSLICLWQMQLYV